MKSNKAKTLILLHIMLLIYSLGGVFAKEASTYPLFSFSFFIYYGLMLIILFGYALLWQMILRKLPLSVAFMNKAVIIIWGIIWGSLIFNEKISKGKIIGTILIILGIIIINMKENDL